MSPVLHAEPAPSSMRRRFAIVAADDEATVLEVFEASGWAPAILLYGERLRTGALTCPASLREARPGEGPASLPAPAGAPSGGVSEGRDP